MIITTGTITAVNGATLPLVYADATGDHVQSTISNLVAGSRVQIYNSTTATEVVNEVVAGTSLNYYHLQTGASYRVRVTKKGYTGWTGNAISGASGFSVLVGQVVNSIYAQFNTDGETVTEFSWDGSNLEVDITDSNNETVIQRIAAWANYFETTETGIRDFFGAITWELYNQVKINSSIASLKLDNKKTAALLLEGGKLYRSDGQSIISSTTTGPIHVVGGVGSAQGSGSASLALDYDAGLTVTARVYTMAGATQGALVTLTDNGSGLYTGTFALTGVPDGQYIVRFLQGSMKVGSGSLFVRGENEVSQEDFFNPNFDIVQSVSATTTNLDALTATQINSEVDTALNDYGGATSLELGLVDDKIDLLETKSQADDRQGILVAEHDATQAAIAGLNNLSLGQVEGSTVIAKEATVAAKLDASAYTAPDNADISAINSRLPAVPASQGDITALNNLSLAQVEASTVLAKEATSGAIKAKTDNLPADPADQSLLEAAISAIPSATSVADEVRVELAPELALIDVATSTRLAGSAYVAPDNAGIAELPTLAEIEASTVLAKEATIVALNDISLVELDASIAVAVADIKGAEDKDLTEVFNNTPSVDLTGIATSAEIADLKGADNRDLTQVYNNTPATDLTPVTDELALVKTQATLARKHLTNRDKIDKVAKTLVRYDDDGITPLVTFDLKNSLGGASTDSIFEKVPQ